MVGESPGRRVGMAPTPSQPLTAEFPAGFRWGTATSSYQVEGGNHLNDWWLWERSPGRIRDGSRCLKAADWWHLAEDDLRLAAQLGQNSHRLSIEWSRLEPERGTWDLAAVERYRRILGTMGDLGMEPMVTLNHFTLPLWFYDRGGWLVSDAAERFARYVSKAVPLLSDLCSLWCTLNEPMVYATYGYLLRHWPPGRGGFLAVIRGMREQARAHWLAYEAIHACQPGARVGVAKHIHLFDAARASNPLDKAAALALDRAFNDAPSDALCRGTLGWPYGMGLWASTSERVCDYIGVNYYTREMVRVGWPWDGGLVQRYANPESEFSMEGWGEVYPDGLWRALEDLRRYDLPLYVTEFGVPDNDDSLRPRAIVDHVAAMRQALDSGVDLRGAYYWSLVDNFEWSEGWSARFGLIGVDPRTQERSVRPSAHVYAAIARANGLDAQTLARGGEYTRRLIAHNGDGG